MFVSPHEIKSTIRNDTCRQQGFTLVELIVVMALMLIVIAGGFSMMTFGNRVFAISTREYDLQASTRLAMEKTNQAVRYSSALFTIPQSSFREDNLSEGWDYVGLHTVTIRPAAGGNPAVTGTELASFKYNTTTHSHDKTVLMAASETLTYKVTFHKNTPINADNLIQYKVEVFRDGEVDEYGLPKATVVLTSELESLNALQVVDQGTAVDPAVALAYRTEDRPTSVMGHIAMVMDNSGSMDWDMRGNDHAAVANKRITILKNEATSLINGFAAEDNIQVSLVPFATTANNPKAFRNARTQTAQLLSDISGMSAIGGTNTGDGLRRAYWQLRDKEATVAAGIRVKNYCVVLVDGVTTFATVSPTNRSQYMTTNGNVLNDDEYARGGQIIGDGSTLDPYGTAYVDQIGTLLSGSDYAKVYVIGFSARRSDLDSVNDIADACNAPPARVFNAADADELGTILTNIREDIINDIWHLQGPRL